MPRINRTIPGTSYPNPQLKEQQEKGNDFDQGPDLDTAARLRETHMRGSMHETRDSDSDARNTPRTESQEITWRRPSNLDAPEPRPGYVQRWVRAEFRTEADNLNWQSKMREGWTPRDPATVPEAETWYVGNNRFMDKAVIRVGGMILVEIPEARLLAKRRAIAQQNERQSSAVNQELEKVSREGVREGAAPIVREERVDVRTGRRPATMAN